MNRFLKISFILSLLAFSACNKPAEKADETKVTTEKAAKAQSSEAKAPLHKATADFQTVTIEDKIMMADNMATAVGNDGSSLTCYANTDADTDFVEHYGCLYTWEDAMKVCPGGWHLPTKVEFESLLGLTKENSTKPLTIWKSKHENSINSSFGALPTAGLYLSGKFDLFGKGAFFWSSTFDSSHAYGIYVFINQINHPYIRNSNKLFAFSVRCVKD